MIRGSEQEKEGRRTSVENDVLKRLGKIKRLWQKPGWYRRHLKC